MKVIVADTAGFCKGVKDALEVTLEAIQKRQDGDSICTFGPLIHNRQVLEMLEEKGIKEENQLRNCAGKKVVIRAHGIPPHERHALHRLNSMLLDATCKRVARVHAVIKQHARKGYNTVIVGDADHAEVIGLMGYTEGRGVVINRLDQVDQLPVTWDKVLLVAQTTQNEEIFEEIREQFLKRYPKGTVKNTICDSTHERQAEVRRMCTRVEAMIVVGGYHSGNTLRLAEVARECGAATYHVETKAELNKQEMARYACVGVSAGASTPNWIIQDVVNFLESIRPEDSGRGYRLKRALELTAYANGLVALGAALLLAVVQALTGLSVSLADSAVAGFYLFAMHSLNIYLDRVSIELNDPGRAAFYHRWRSFIKGTSLLGLVASLLLALHNGIVAFFAMVVMVVLGILYGIPWILPARWQNLPSLKIKDIPASKTLLIPVAWASVIVILPHLTSLWSSFGRLAYAFWIIFLMVLIRTALLDLLAVHGDRLVGKETLVVLVGETKAARLIMAMIGGLALSLTMGPILGISNQFAYAVLPVAGVYGWYLKMFHQKRYKEDPISETLIESALIGIGIVAGLWNLAN